MRQAQETWLGQALAWPRKVLTEAIAQVEKRYRDLKNRYGPRYTRAMVSVAFLALFLPLPGSAPVAVALIVVIAELHRAISSRRGFPEASAALVAPAKAPMPGWAAARGPASPLFPGATGTSPRQLGMSISCDVILHWGSTPEVLRALGAALWRWCSGAAGDTGICQYLDNQALADLLAGRLPASEPRARNAGLPHVHFLVRGDPARGREAMLESLRRALPGEGIADVRIDGLSWRRGEGEEGPSSPRTA